MNLIGIFLLICLPFLVYSDTWAVLLSGIYDWDYLGYSAEADVYQAYYQLVKGGIDPDKIIVFAMNGTAFNPKNPHPGVVFNYPGGPNVYPFISGKMDYVFHDNTPENFFKVLKGEEMSVGSKRTLKSTEDDYVFIASTQHGGPGILEWVYDKPKGSKSPTTEMTYAYDIIDTLKTMIEKKKFKALVWYMTACFSGSLFNKEFKDSDSVFIVTGASVERSATACDFSPDFKMPINSCLQKRWHKFDRDNNGYLSLYDQFLWVYSQKESDYRYTEEYCPYGNIEFAKSTPFTDFQGDFKNSDDIIPSLEDNLDHIAFPKIQKFSDYRYNNNDINNKKNDEEIILQTPTMTTTSIIKGFDSDFVYCSAYPLVNEDCSKKVIKYVTTNFPKCFIEKKLSMLYWFDWVRNSCSSDQGTIDPNQMIQQMKNLCTSS